MALLFGRICQVTVGSQLWEDLHMAFKVKRTVTSKPNQTELAIWNLSAEDRRACETAGAQVRIVAGYPETASLLCMGDLWDATHERTDSGDIITTIKANDGDRGWRNQLRRSWTGGTRKRDVVKVLGEAMGLGIADSTLDLVDGIYEAPRVVSGPAVLALDRIANTLGLYWSIQNEQLVLVPLDGATTETAVVLSAETGLIGSPEVQPRKPGTRANPSQHGMVTAVSLINPLLTPGRRVLLEAELVRGDFRVDEVEHSGDTHDASKWTSTCKLRPTRR